MIAFPARAEDRLVRLAAPPELVESGFLKYALPRFSLKTQVKVSLVEAGQENDLTFQAGPPGVPVFFGLNQVWYAESANTDHPGTQKLMTWLRSEVGERTIASFQIDGTHPFSPPQIAEAAVADTITSGDAIKGKALSLTHCGRCHVVAPENRMNAIGSTPSFNALRTLADWEGRFQSFFALNPHPSFTQIADVTEPFPEDRPSPIVPLELTLDDLDAILAYVAAIEPADLGSVLEHQ